MTSASSADDGVTIRLSKPEALVFFEWLARTSESPEWDDGDLFVDPAEARLLASIECDLESILVEPFDSDYGELVVVARRAILPDPNEQH